MSQPQNTGYPPQYGFAGVQQGVHVNQPGVHFQQPQAGAVYVSHRKWRVGDFLVPFLTVPHLRFQNLP